MGVVKAGYKGSSGHRGHHRILRPVSQKVLSLPQPMEKSWQQVKTSNPPPQEEGWGQELNANVKELTNLGTLQVSTFKLHVDSIKQLLPCQIQCFKAGCISTCYSRWLYLNLHWKKYQISTCLFVCKKENPYVYLQLYSVFMLGYCMDNCCIKYSNLVCHIKNNHGNFIFHIHSVSIFHFSFRH